MAEKSVSGDWVLGNRENQKIAFDAAYPTLEAKKWFGVALSCELFLNIEIYETKRLCLGDQSPILSFIRNYGMAFAFQQDWVDNHMINSESSIVGNLLHWAAAYVNKTDVVKDDQSVNESLPIEKTTFGRDCVITDDDDFNAKIDKVVWQNREKTAEVIKEVIEILSSLGGDFLNAKIVEIMPYIPYNHLVGYTPIQVAVYQENWPAVMLLLREPAVDINVIELLKLTREYLGFPPYKIRKILLVEGVLAQLLRMKLSTKKQVDEAINLVRWAGSMLEDRGSAYTIGKADPALKDPVIIQQARERVKNFPQSLKTAMGLK